jgi:ubiquinone/menaquinone biosynthesis C-methylase UbiE
MPKHAALYEELAQYYDQIYHWKNYRKEVRKLKTLIRTYKRSPGKDLLDVACGTGKHLSFLRREFDCMGVDASEEMLAVARKNVPEVQFSKGELVDFDVGRRFDAVLCLFSSIGYLRTRRAVNRALTNLARHMKEGGVLIVEPWLRKSAWSDRTVHMQRYESDSLKMARVSFVHAEGTLSVLDERYLIAKKGKGVSYIKDLHKMRFFEMEPTLLALRKAGLVPKFTEDSLMPGRGLIIATKPLT